MAKKNIIRHLEFYGFIDQNTYNGIGNVDLSDIRETNKEQDEEIEKISGETQNKASIEDLSALSGKVDTFIDGQNLLNGEIINSISGMTDKINEIADDVNDQEEKIETLENTLSSHVNDFNEYVNSTATQLSKIDEKLDITIAEEEYAKKTDVYTKDEVYRKEEVDEKNLLQDQTIEALVENDENIELTLESYSGIIASIQDEISSINSGDTLVNEKINAISGNVDTKFQTIETQVDTINSSIETIEANVLSNTNDITSIKSDVESLTQSVEDLSANKADKTALTNAVNDIDEQLQALEEKKADKETVNGEIARLGNEIASETADRIQDINTLQGEINDTNLVVSGLTDDSLNIHDELDSLQEELYQEIENRKEGDIALIGDDTDVSSNDTIWGAKAFAVVQKGNAIASANHYTNEKLGEFDTRFTNKLDEVETEISAKASTEYVNSLVDDRASTLRSDLTNELNLQTEALRSKDEELEENLNNLKTQVESGDTKDIYKRLNVITTYSGDTAEGYVDTGNGILDVLHREFHQFEDEFELNPNPTLVKKNQYESAFGTYNVSHSSSEDSGSTIFSVGIGVSDYDRKNAVEIMKNGDIYMWVEGEFTKINDLLAMLAHEQY
jgi:uncharacterized protein YoxC